MKDPIFQLCDRIRETSLALHQHLRHGHVEKVYENGLAHRLRKQNLTTIQQHPLSVHDEDGTLLGEFFADLFVEHQLIVELKACRALADEHIAQLLGYLRASRMEPRPADQLWRATSGDSQVRAIVHRLIPCAFCASLRLFSVMPPPPPRLSHERLVFLQALAGGLPAVVIALILLWRGEFSAKVQWTLGLLIVGSWLGFALAVQARVVRPLQTMANLLSALREGDFSVRARGARRDEPLGDAMAEINTLSRTLQEQRLSALEATALLRTVMEEIEVAVFAFDGEGKLRLANHAGQILLRKPAERILGRDAVELGLEECLTGEPTRILTTTFPGGSGRWGMRRSMFREGGRPHHLIVIADLSRTLREEELHAWQRLVRVLGHELNNSLAPIKSIAGSLGTLLRKEKRAPDWEDDMRSGLEIIESRADGLSRFMQSYARLARLPAPTFAPCAIAPLIRRVAALESRLPVEVVAGPDLTLSCDAAQIEQVLINLFKNAVEATLETAAADRPCGVSVTWQKQGGQLEILVQDCGPGIANTTNLFVPFFTTKAEGSGIGLVLCRQIVENHRGSLTLENRSDVQGCIARFSLPA